MRLLHRPGVCALALVAGSAAMQFEPTVLRGIAFDNGSQRITVGAVKVPLWSAALAQSAESFSLENVKFAFGTATYEAKRIEFSGVTSPRADIEALFSSAEPMASRLAKISAKQVTAPEIRVTQKIGPETEAIVYKNVVFSDIVQGRIASITIDATAVEALSGKSPLLFSYGKTSVSELDIPAFAKLYETKAESDSAPMSRIHGAFSIEDMELSDPKEGVSFKIARIGGRDFMARPTRDSWAGTTTFLAEIGAKDDLTSEEQARLMATVADLLGAFDIGLVEATGIEMQAPSKDKAKQGGKNSPVNARIGRIAYTGGSGTQPADVRVEGMEITEPDGYVKIGTISLTGFSLAPTINGLKTLQGKSFDDIDATTARSLAPTLGTLRLSGIDIDAMSSEEGNKKSERVKATLKDFEFTADKPINAIPTNIRIGLQNFVMALPPTSREEGIKDLIDLGYKAIDMSFAISATWNEGANEITLKEASIQGQDMGSISLTGLIGSVSKELFHSDIGLASVAALAAKAKSLDIVIENQGLLDRYLAKAAKEQKTTQDALRKTYSSAAPGVISALIGPSEQAKSLGQAISRFIATKPGKLTINVRPKNPAGFGFIDAALLPEPKAALEQLNIKAAAE